jgi:hypothetical protein
MKIPPFRYPSEQMDEKERDVLNALITQFVDLSNTIKATPTTTVNAALNFAAQIICQTAINAGANQKQARDWAELGGDVLVDLVDRNWDRFKSHIQKQTQ